MNIQIPFVDSFLNRITMYRLVLYHLTLLFVVAVALAFAGLLSFSAESLIYSTAIILAACWTSNELFAWGWKVTPNIESVYITGFIIALIATPVAPANIHGAILLVIASVVAMGSKFVLAPYKQHIYNPAALGVLVVGLLFNTYAGWWVGGNLVLLPLVAIGGLLIVRKIQRFDMFFGFAFVAAVGTCISFLPFSPWDTLQDFIIHSSALFLATVMLTEPLTSPPQKLHRIIYAAIVGFFFIPSIHIGSFYTSPELALVVGNIYAYMVMPKSRRVLTLVQSQEVAEGVWDFAFTPDKPLTFKAGQYLEWTLGHKNSDSRGNRRYFTISSSPSQNEIYLGVKMYEPSSSFKKALKALKPGDTISAGQLAGEFTLPEDKAKKFVFIAGGIGITPFCSIVQDMVDTKDARDSVLFYSNKTRAEIAYKDFFDDAATKLKLKNVYWVTSEMGFMDGSSITREVPDYKERTYYISGPHSMVVAFQKTLASLGVPSSQIKVDFFPGFV